MASDNRKIIIEIRDSNTTQNSSAKNNNEYKKNKKNSLKLAKEEIKKEELKNILVNQAYNQAKALIKQSVQSSLNRYYNMKENYMLENDIQQFQNIANKTGNFITTVAAGASIGGPVGATIAAGSWVINETIGTANKWADVYAQINADNYNKTFTKKRIGLVDNGRGTEN